MEASPNARQAEWQLSFSYLKLAIPEIIPLLKGQQL